MGTTGKNIREHVARARSALRSDDLLKSASAMISALEQFVESRLIGTEKFETEAAVSDYLGEFNKHPSVREFFYGLGKHSQPFIKYKRGNEGNLLRKFEKIEQHQKVATAQAEEDAQRKHEHKRDELIHKGQQCLDAGDMPRGCGAFRRAVEAFGDEPGLIADLADRLYKAKMYRETAEFAEKAIDKFPSDPKPYSLAVKTYMEIGDYDACEKVFLAVLKRFGAHPKTYQSMARMYLEWRNFDKAYDFAKQALDKDPGLKIAKQIMDKVGKRMFTG